MDTPVPVPEIAQLHQTMLYILKLMHDAGMNLSDPMTVLALNLMGPTIAMVLDDSPRPHIENLIQLAEELNLEPIRKLMTR